MFSILREVKLADVFSLLNLVFGFSGIYMREISFVFLAAIMDGVDGIVATKSSGKFGKELDSLADLVSFGVLPAVFIAAHNPVIAAFYVIAAALRLARFNVLRVEHFVGLPVTASALLIAPAVNLRFGSSAICFIALTSALLMISDVKYIRVRDLRILSVVAAAILAAFFVKDAAYAVFFAFLLYLVSPLWRRREYMW
ncbi:CDP-alcohol phosphatidyltransferase family protein [Archaeoglobus veneficus]|uniref:CDP-diacylglycerol/serineO-phosphatidyltransferase n=1 Tax=Archaeoglobus veneficus (strain DSM 11195 / SNP6) TaxID=693661 RepID=F2KPK1_ARCVS|nr:CDP-alcohol phosphatidyltransferase family protein [Archaeoglobus veneficus]AEA46432.1 CDP-diacylglycerol/serineO-phosphatidyltransferase [Archaeoglobus veneficus SNP6]